MNIVNSGNKFIVYGEEVQTYKQLPANTYKVCFNSMSGFSLKLHPDLNVCERIYGNTPNKVDKVLNTFKKFNRNMGIILSGEKGSGKSVFARLLAEKGKELNLPLIIVDEPFKGVEDFLESITQECIVLFDEFEKNFDFDDGDNDKTTQDKLLSLFDGVDNGKKLYVITCNEIEEISIYLLNRPGRFHYHFTFGVPTAEEIKEYLENNLTGNAVEYIPDILRMSAFADFTYDVLRAIVFELNNGYGLSETLEDLNIERARSIKIQLTLTFANGVKATGVGELRFRNSSYYDEVCFDYTTLPEEVSAIDFSKEVRLIVTFPIRKLSVTSEGMKISAQSVNINPINGVMDEESKKVVDNFMSSLKITDVKIERVSQYEDCKLNLF